jgi:hypothetical protein
MGEVINMFAARAGMDKDRMVSREDAQSIDPMTLFMCSCGCMEFYLTNNGPECVECHDPAHEWIDSIIAETSTPA